MKLAIFLQHHKVHCFSCDAAGQWHRKRIKGEAVVDIKPAQTGALTPVLQEVSAQLNLEHDLQGIDVHLLYAQTDVAAVADAPTSLKALHCSTWQILRLEPLLERSMAASGVTPAQPLEGDDAWIKKVLLPLLASTFSYTNQAFAAEEARAKHEHEDTMESLRADVQTKRQEVAQLQARINSLQLPGVDHLLSYLPAIYRNFWGTVRPDELAMLAGTLTVPIVQSPYPDPSPDTVVALKRRFLQLPELDRQRVLAFCRDLPHRLDVRTEWRDLMEKKMNLDMNKDERKRLERLQEDGPKGVAGYLLKDLTYPDLQLLLVADETTRRLIRQICESPAATEAPCTEPAAPGNDHDKEESSDMGRKKDELKEALKAEEKKVKTLTASLKKTEQELSTTQNDLAESKSKLIFTTKNLQTAEQSALSLSANLSEMQTELATALRECSQLQTQLTAAERKLKAPATHPLLTQLSPELALLKALLADDELRAQWHLDKDDNPGRQLARLLANLADWDDGVCTLWDKLATRCKADQRTATPTEISMLQTALDLHNLRYQHRAATLQSTDLGAGFHHEHMQRGTPKGNTVTAVWLPGLNSAAGKLLKFPVVELK